MPVSSSQPSGFLNLDKPQGITSHDVVAKVRRIAQTKKVGHAGTLDPMATGVLIVCLGNATRLSEYAMHQTKTYRATIHLGIATDTYDAAGTTRATNPTPVSRAALDAILPQFQGDIQQVPPMYSAIKQDGKRLYDLARQGKTVELEPRPVTIHTLTVERWAFPQVDVRVQCSAGTYIRSLAHDIGVLLGVGGHLSALRRVQSGDFSIETAITLDALAGLAEDWTSALLPNDFALSDIPRLDLTAEDVKIVLHGGWIYGDAVLPLARAYTPAGELCALLEPSSPTQWKPKKVLLADA